MSVLKEKDMKVLHLTSGGDVGGAKTHIISLTAALSAEIDVRLISFREGRFTEEASEAGVRTDVQRGGLFRAVGRIKKQIAEQGCDVVHCHGSKANVAGMLLKIFGCKARFVTTMHSDYRKDYLGLPLKQYTFGIMNAMALRFFDEYLVVSDAMAEVLIERGFDPNRIMHIFNGIVFDGKSGKTDRKAFWEEKGVPYDPQDVIVGIAARLTAVKDIKTLITGFAKAFAAEPHLRLVIAGDGEEREMLKALAESLHMSEQIHFLGWLTDIKHFYEAIDINTMTSLSEGFPYALLEGINAGCATVSSSVKVACELIEDKKDGYIFPIGDSDALCACLTALAADKDVRQGFAERLFERCARTFSLERMKTLQIEIYSRLVARAARKGRQGVCICGAYGRGNAGDDALLDAILDEMRGIDKDMPLWVLSKNPRATRLSNRVGAIYTFNVVSFIKRLGKSKLFISGGGNLIQDDTSTRSLYFYLFTIMMGKLMGNKVMMYGCGVGPVSKQGNKRITARCLNRYVDHITLRETESYGILADLGVHQPVISLAADPALNLRPKGEEVVRAALHAESIPPEGNYLCVSVRNWPGFSEAAQAIAGAVDYACARYGFEPVFLPIELSKTRAMDNDQTAVDKVVSYMKTPRIHIIRNRYDAATTIGIISKMKIILSMRLHALVFAAGQGVPTIAVSYGPKVKGFMNYMGQNMCMDVSDTDEMLLKQYIDEAVSKSRDNEENVRQVGRLREMEFVNIKVAKELLGCER